MGVGRTAAHPYSSKDGEGFGEMLDLAVRPYGRPFHKPLQTHHGVWENREGLIIQLRDEQGRIGFGEIAPIPWFGTETLTMAKDLCAKLSQTLVPEAIAAIPDSLPACQFGFSSALRSLEFARNRAPCDSENDHIGHVSKEPDPWICALLPTGANALDAWPALWQKGHRTFKWKIGVASPSDEISLFQTLITAMPSDTHLRLDANGGLTLEATKQWLTACDATQSKVEFLEQPLPPSYPLDSLGVVVENFRTMIALDESVATIKQLQQVCQRLQNRVWYVVKPAIAGFPAPLKALCAEHHLDVVFSSALETPVGRQAALDLAQELWHLGVPKRALGFGVGHWFRDNWDTLTDTELWQQL